MIGCFKPKARENWKSLCITRSSNEAYNRFLTLNGSFIQVHNIDNEDFYQVFNKYFTETDETESPIYNQILEAEIIELYKLSKIIESKNGIVTALNTDSASCIFPTNDLPFDLFDDDINIKGYYYDVAQTLPKYKIEHKESNIVNAKLAKFKRTDTYEHVDKVWKITADVTDNDFSPLVKFIMDDSKSIIINGRAGCGKSTLITQIQADLTERGILFESLAPTNKSANIIDGMTMHKFVKLYSSRKSIREMKFKTILGDEMSMVSENFYKYFITLKRMRPDIQFILGGDYAQLLPVKDRIENCDYENSSALHELTDGNRLVLTTCRRSDSTVYNMCLPQNINKLTKSDFTHKKTTTNICFTNKCRKQINSEKMAEAIEANKKGSKSKVVKIKAYAYSDKSQDMTLLKGMPIIARMTTDYADNNEMFTIKSATDEIITLIGSNKNDIPIEVLTEEFARLFTIAYCITIHSCQGESYDFPYSIYEFNKLDARLKYVALSRSTKKSYINII